jgi:hypothetical protein
MNLLGRDKKLTGNLTITLLIRLREINRASEIESMNIKQ